MIVTAGKTNVSVYFYIVQDASGTSPGEPVTGLLFSDIETGGNAHYMRQGAAAVDVTPVVTIASASTAHADGSFILVDDTNMPGLYRFDVPDAAFATGVDQVVIQLVVASAKNAVCAPIMVDLTDVDLRDSVRAGLTALPNAAAEAAGGLFTRGTGAGQINQDANGRADVNAVAWNELSTIALPATPTNITAATGVVLSGVTHTGAVIPSVTTVTGNVNGTVAGVTPAAAGAQMDLVNAPNATAITAINSGMATTANVSAVETDTQDIQSRLPAALTGAGSIKADILAISGSTVAADTLEASMLATISGTLTSFTNSTTVVDTGLTAIAPTNEMLTGRVIVFYTDTGKYEAARITAYTASTGTLTVTTLASTVTGTASYVIV